MLRIRFIVIVQFIFFFAHSQKTNFTVKGNYNGTNGTPIYLKYTKGDKTVIDTSKLLNNQFLFSGLVEEPSQAYVTDQGNIIQFMPFFMLHKNDHITINLINNTFENVILQGSIDNQQLNRFRAFYKTRDSIYQVKIKDLDRERDDSIIQIFNKSKKSDLADYCKKFVENNPNSYVSIFLLYDVINENELLADSLFKTLNPKIQQSIYGQKCKSAIDFKSLSAIGKKAPNFVLKDTSGIEHTLNSYTGKYVLIDFWASWCGPCRAETPNILKAYSNYSHRNFEVIGVSIDDGFHFLAWKDAIVKDKTTWLQLLDDKTANVADGYGISYIPANVLINPQGVIIAKNIKGPALWDALNTYLK